MGPVAMHGGVRTLTKRLLEGVVTLRPVVARLKRRASGASIILAYHNVLPEGEEVSGSPGAHLRLSDFRWQLDLLEELGTVVPVEHLLDPRSPTEGLRVALTFDDAYVGTLEVALPELEARGLPSTVFVPTGLVGRGAFWWDALGISGWEGERVPLEELRGDGGRIRSWAESRGIVVRPQGRSQVASTEEGILRSQRFSGVTFGVHTVGHPNLTRLSPEEIESELTGARKWLLERSLPECSWLSYPYGLTSPRVEEVARSLGFPAAVTITGGWIPPQPANRLRLPRLPVPAGLSREGFLLRLLGVIRG